MTLGVQHNYSGKSPLGAVDTGAWWSKGIRPSPWYRAITTTINLRSVEINCDQRPTEFTMKFYNSLFSVAAGLGLLVQTQAAALAEPVNRNASTSARRLLTYLNKTTSNSTTLSGQQELEDAEWLAQNVGHSPAVLGVDLMDYSPSRVELGAKSHAVEDAISYSKRGGIITICWHWG